LRDVHDPRSEMIGPPRIAREVREHRHVSSLIPA
jgi:hypothetical protein